jgi:hypothetical protein
MTPFAEIDALAWSTIALAIATVSLAAIALVQLAASARSEARRALPVAITHQIGPRKEYDTFRVYLTNEGTGAAFNVRFGVKLDDIEYVAGEGRGHRSLVSAGGRLPAVGEEALPVKVSLAPYALQRGGPDVDKRAVFFARYEDTRGKTWETRNPSDPTADFEIGRAPRRLRRYEIAQAEKRQGADMTANKAIAEDLMRLQARAEADAAP